MLHGALSLSEPCRLNPGSIAVLCDNVSQAKETGLLVAFGVQSAGKVTS